MTDASLIAVPSAVAALALGAAVCLVACLLVVADRQLRRLPRGLLSVVLLSAAIATVSAQKANTNSLSGGSSSAPQGGMGLLPVHATLHVSPFTFNPPTGGFRLDGVTTNAEYSYAMPTNGEVRGTWHLRGAYDDVTRVGLDGLGGLGFPLGSEVVTSVWAHAWGLVRPHLASPTNEVAVVGAPMSAIPNVSCFWTAPTPSNTYLLTWQDFAPGRVPPSSVPDPASLVSAQLELRANGDFVARSNDVAYVCRRVNPDDWDGDGWLNDEDANPDVFDDGGFGPHQTLPEDANSNAYCWVDLVVSQADATVAFAGDGPSDLPDPQFVARAGATNRVMLLIGKTYTVTCDMPFAVVGKSSDEIEEAWEDSRTLWLNWPVAIWAEDDDEPPLVQGALPPPGSQLLAALLPRPRLLSSPGGGARSFTMHVVPSGLGGAFSWTNGCCAVTSPGGWTYSFTCAENCLCTGCGAEGYYGYEGYRLPASSGVCGCSSYEVDAAGDDEELPDVGVSVWFSKDAVIFEDAYVPSPGESVQKRSTTVKLRVSACGGPHGGTVSFTAANLDKLSPLACGPLLLPSNLVLAPMATYSEEFKCEGAVASGSEDDVVVSGSFVENVTGQTYDAQDQITVFRVEIAPFRHAKLNTCDGRHKYGVRELVNISQFPTSPALTWSHMGGGRVNGDKYQCPITEANKPLCMTFGDAEYEPCLSVIGPSSIKVLSVTERRYGAPIGEAGGIGMDCELALRPLDVSFSEIMVEEVPCYTGWRSGYFAHPAFDSLESHTRANGAGRWMRPDNNNVYATDHVCITSNIPRITPEGVLTNDAQFGWAHGEIFWDVPSGWGELNSVAFDPPVELLPENVTQRVVLFDDGTCGVRKFHHQVTRTTNDVVILDGEVK